MSIRRRLIMSDRLLFFLGCFLIVTGLTASIVVYPMTQLFRCYEEVQKEHHDLTCIIVRYPETDKIAVHVVDTGHPEFLIVYDHPNWPDVKED